MSVHVRLTRISTTMGSGFCGNVTASDGDCNASGDRARPPLHTTVFAGTPEVPVAAMPRGDRASEPVALTRPTGVNTEKIPAQPTSLVLPEILLVTVCAPAFSARL